eukprot:403344388
MSFSISQIEALSGLCAGMVSSFVSHPIDTVKIRMQLQAQGANLKLVPTVSGIYYHEGVRGFYKGVLSPIVGKAPLASVVFSSLTFSKRQLQPYNLTDTQRTLISGFFAGICYANTALIFDFFKIRAQNTKNSTMSYREEIKRVYLKDGLLGFTRGWTSIVIRDAPGLAIYFTLFDTFKRWLSIPQIEAQIKLKNETYLKNEKEYLIKDNSNGSLQINDNLSNYYQNNNVKEHAHLFLRRFIAGGFAGAIQWFLAYPMDVVKSRIYL